ncbi:MAG: tellurite resistance protein [Myxococcota bacterium]|jgi:tellurite resistance protein
MSELIPNATALIEAMVIGAHIGGGMTPDRSDVMNTIVRDHSAFTDQRPADLDAEVQAAIVRIAADSPTGRLTALSGSVSSQVAFQLMVIIALVEEEGEEKTDELLAAGEALGLENRSAWAVLEAGIPPALMDVRVPAAPEETYLDVLLAAAAADGQLADEEMVALINFARSRLELREIPRKEIGDLMQASLQGFLDYGFKFWLDTLADDLPETEQRETALRLATEMVEADGEVADSETEFLAALRLALNL